jgi:hypothetical protein
MNPKPRNQIYEFYLSHHFMERGWDRSIDKEVLIRLLPFVRATEPGKNIVVFTPGFYRSKCLKGKENKSLVLVISHNCIKTGYWCEHPNYLFRTEPNAHFQWHYT